MVLKLTVGTVLLFSSWAIGYLISLKYGLRVRQIEYFISALNSLENDIVYYSNPLPVAMKRIADRSHKSIAWVFEETWEKLNNREGNGIDEAWKQVINNNIDLLFLTGEDIEIIVDFAKELGLGNKETQRKHFEYTKILLIQQKGKAIKEKEKNGKIFNKLGALLGLAIVIILI
ncbi:stage III sporulation protein AB [Paramaledivibacter caminithermalis]|uniref:Stage III sporulation protein AB (Spore_III_AB) n=1 Tax=Paramaledivibacter caminithermalis (strain DSM 15212 / CIP 107654 / DViRD3) TaxID=1121301 RepID=A0A1M6JR75_PARC5|nr:stage III sporulation protein AB [Paramaledivibacter caminithermalis]SHJ49187.1 Stage III sporulation protein AB (spore_III_AB) [Paramaledivibacter caminithermalis DSM 15212]